MKNKKLTTEEKLRTFIRKEAKKMLSEKDSENFIGDYTYNELKQYIRDIYKSSNSGDYKEISSKAKTFWDEMLEAENVLIKIGLMKNDGEPGDAYFIPTNKLSDSKLIKLAKFSDQLARKYGL